MTNKTGHEGHVMPVSPKPPAAKPTNEKPKTKAPPPAKPPAKKAGGAEQAQTQIVARFVMRRCKNTC